MFILIDGNGTPNRIIYNIYIIIIIEYIDINIIYSITIIAKNIDKLVRLLDIYLIMLLFFHLNINNQEEIVDVYNIKHHQKSKHNKLIQIQTSYFFFFFCFLL